VHLTVGPGVGISFVRRAAGSSGTADSKFVVKRLVQGSDAAMQGDVEVNDVVVRVRVLLQQLIAAAARDEQLFAG
jgi:hypothetical protein